MMSRFQQQGMLAKPEAAARLTALLERGQLIAGGDVARVDH